MISYANAHSLPLKSRIPRFLATFDRRLKLDKKRLCGVCIFTLTLQHYLGIFASLSLIHKYLHVCYPLRQRSSGSEGLVWHCLLAPKTPPEKYWVQCHSQCHWRKTTRPGDQTIPFAKRRSTFSIIIDPDG